MFIHLFLIFMLLLVALTLYYREKRKYKGIEKIPGPIALPLVGNSFSFGFDIVAFFDSLHRHHQNYGRTIRIWPIWLEPLVSTQDADCIQTILNSTIHIDKSREYNLLSPWLHDGLLLSTGAKWHERRKLLTPAFHFKILEQFIDVFYKESNVLIDKLSHQVEHKSFNIYPFIKNCALDIICKTALGTNVSAQHGENEYCTAMNKFLLFALDREFSIWKNFDSAYKLSVEYYQSKKCIKILQKFTDSIITSRRKLLKEKVTADNTDEDLNYKKKFAFLDLLIKTADADKKLKHEDIREEVDTFTFEGHDTITSAITFILYEISKHPEVQNKLIEEMNTVLSDDNKNDELTYGQLQELNYLSCVIKEGMRLYPPVPRYLRRLNETVQLGKYSVPPKSTVLINVFVMHRDENYFPNPTEFIPERFLNENLVGRHPFCYLPFSAGPRNCIGMIYVQHD